MKQFLFTILRNFFVVFSVSMFILGQAHARWATIEDTEVLLEKFYRQVDVRKDGTYTETIEMTAEVLKESGKDKLVSMPLVYNASNSKLKIIEAKTIRDGKEFPVNLKNIEDKPLASSPHGFDQNNQILIAFPEMAVNAKAYIKYQTDFSEVPVPEFFSTDFIFGMNQYFKNADVKVSSEIPFFMQVNDPEQYLDVKQIQNGSKYEMTIQLKRPIIKSPIDENFVALDSKAYPWVSISTLDQWSKLGEKMVKRYDTVISQKLPELFETIALEAEKKLSTIEKINAITSQLAEKITYMGDWRTVKGGYIPRNLAEIVQSKYGDCKDFSASTTAILKRIGLKAEVALVNRGVENYDSPNNLPNLYDFNHAFVRVQEGATTYWIDPTNFTSFAQGIYPDVADRKTLVLDPKGSLLAQTSKISSEDSYVNLVKKVILSNEDPDLALVAGEIILKGVHALPLIGADLRSSKESIDYDIIRSVADETRTIGWKIGNYNLTSRIAEDLNFQFQFTQKHTKLNTTAGNAFIVPTQFLINKILTKTNDRITGLQLDIPSTYRNETLISKTSLVGNLSNCSVDSPWVKGNRKIVNSDEGIRVVDELKILKNKILLPELKSEEYADFQNKVHACFGDTALVYKSK